MVRIFAHSTSGQPSLFVLRMTVTISLTMTGLEAVRVLEERGTRKNVNTKRNDHKIRAALPIQYDFPYRYVFPANHPFSSYAQFLGLPPAATPPYSGGGGGGGGGGGSSTNYELYSPIVPPQFASSLYQHQHLHQHQHQLQLQPPPPQPQQPPPPLPPPLQPEFKYTLKPTSSNGHAHPPPSSSSSSPSMGPFQTGSAPTVLLLHATNPAAGSVQTFLLIPASSTTTAAASGAPDGTPSFGLGTPFPPNLLNAINAAAFSLSGILPGAAAQSTAAGATATHGTPLAPSPMVLRTAAGHTKIANSHFHNQLAAAQLLARPLAGGVYQLPLMPPPSPKYYKRKKGGGSIESKMSEAAADGGNAQPSRGGALATTEDSASPPQIRNGHASRMPASVEGDADSFDEYVPENGPRAPPKRS